MAPENQDRWSIGGGDVHAAVVDVARRQSAGALLSIEARRSMRKKAVEAQPQIEQQLLEKGWKIAAASVPPPRVGCRSAFARFEFALEGPKEELLAAGRALLERLAHLEPSFFEWRIVLVQLLSDVQRTLKADPAYDVDKVNGHILVWVTPYLGEDWSEPQRYPQVSLVASIPAARQP